MPWPSGFVVKNGLENSPNRLLGHANACIGHGERDILSGRQIAFRSRVCVKASVGCLDRQTATVRHGVPSVYAEVEEGVFQLVLIDQNRPQPSRADHFDLDVWTGRAAHELFHIGNQTVQIRRLRIEGLAARKRQQSLRQCGSSLRGALRSIDIARHGIQPPLRKPGLQHLQASGDSRQEIVKVVCNASRQLAHRFHLLRLAQGLLGLLALFDGQLHPGFKLLIQFTKRRFDGAPVFDVYQDPRKPQRSAVFVVVHPAICFDPAEDPVMLTHTVFAAIRAAALQGFADFGLDSFPVLLVD